MEIVKVDQVKLIGLIKMYSLPKVEYLIYNKKYLSKRYEPEDYILFLAKLVVSRIEKNESENLNKKIIHYFTYYVSNTDVIANEVKVEVLKLVRNNVGVWHYLGNCNDGVLKKDFGILERYFEIWKNNLGVEVINETVEKTDELLVQKIEELEQKIAYLNKCLEDKDIELAESLKLKTEALKMVSQIKKELKDKKIYEHVLQDRVTKALKESENLQKKLAGATNENDRLQKENDELSLENDKLNSTITVLNNEYDELQKAKDNLANLLDNAQSKDVKMVIPQLSVLFQNPELFYSFAKIYKILEEPTTLKELYNFLRENDESMTLEKFNYLLELVKKYSQIKKVNISRNPRVVLQSDITNIGNVYHFAGCRNDVINFLFISDTHFDYGNIGQALKKLDSLYNYAVANNINYVFNLGDIFDTYYGDVRLSHDEFISKYLPLVNLFIEDAPKSSEVVSSYLGGNHDEYFAYCGLDLLQLLDSEREDIFSLGYRNATITFGDNSSNSIGLYHYSKSPVCIKEKDRVSSRYLTSIKNNFAIANDCERNYLNISGHVHLSRFDADNHYLFLPAFQRSDKLTSAFEIDVYFDEFKNIKYILLFPMVYVSGFTKTAEIVYQKKLTKPTNA